jgi:hypothetical protein
MYGPQNYFVRFFMYFPRFFALCAFFHTRLKCIRRSGEKSVTMSGWRGFEAKQTSRAERSIWFPTPRANSIPQM